MKVNVSEETFKEESEDDIMANKRRHESILKIKKTSFIIDPKKIREGTCQIKPFGKQFFAVCKEGSKIKIFPTTSKKKRSLC